MLVLSCEERSLIGTLEPLPGDGVTDLLYLLRAAEVPWGCRRLLRRVLENGGLEVLSLLPFCLAVGDEPLDELTLLVAFQLLGGGAPQPDDTASLEHRLAVGAGKLPLLWHGRPRGHPLGLKHAPLKSFELRLDLGGVRNPGRLLYRHPLEPHAGDGRERLVLYPGNPL